MALSNACRIARAVLLLLPFALTASICLAQYPPGQYPPQYPPGQYPPGQYPTDTVPMRLPGGVPIGIPVPEIKLPKRGSKDDKSAQGGRDAIKMNLLGVDGALRELGEKELFLEVSGKRILHFRVLAKTEFRNKEGEPVRDSLLKPGDQLSIRANKVDPETALRIVLSRNGAAAERAAASRPFDHDSAITPVEADLHPAGTIEDAGGTDSGARSDSTAASAPSNSGSPARPGLMRRDEPASAPAPRMDAAPGDDIIASAREAADAFNDEIPNFIVEQWTARYASRSYPARWIPLDTVSAEVVCVDGKEDYRNILLNGRPSRQPIEKTGAWSTGEFVTTLRSIFSRASAATFTRRGEDTVLGRPVYVYDFQVRRENSSWNIVAPDGRSEAPAYTGSIWIDREQHRVLRIEQRTGPMAPSFPYDKAEATLEYGFVRIDAKTYLLPVRSENLTCARDSANCTRNDIEFRNYRKFSADSNIVFDKFRVTNN